MLIYSCTDGVSLGPGHCQMIMQPALTDRALEDMPPSLLLEWSRDRGLSTREADCPLIRLAVLPVPEQQLFACGRLGYIARIHRGLLAEETIEGPPDQGFLRDLRVIGTHLYAAGMGRQAYRRHDSGRWTRWDAGLLPNSEDVLDIRGINAIDGFTEDDMYAVGFQGEIWRYVRGAWHEVESPTNLILERVRVVRPDRAYSAGQVGTLLRGHGDTWEHVKQTTTEDDFWGMEWFRDRLYLATRNGLYVLVEDDELEPVDTGLPGPRTSAQLHAANGALWSFGPQHLAWTEDGTTWNDVVLGP
jgi:hypothetical protein